MWTGVYAPVHKKTVSGHVMRDIDHSSISGVTCSAFVSSSSQRELCIGPDR